MSSQRAHSLTSTQRKTNLIASLIGFMILLAVSAGSVVEVALYSLNGDACAGKRCNYPLESFASVLSVALGFVVPLAVAIFVLIFHSRLKQAWLAPGVGIVVMIGSGFLSVWLLRISFAGS